MAKVPLARAILEGRDSPWARELYVAGLTSLMPLRNFSEDDRKFSELDYESAFREVCISLRDLGFQDSMSKIPLSKSGEIWNGAHRIAAALALGIDVRVEQTTEIPQIYDFRFFEKSGIHGIYLDEMARIFLSLKDSSRAIVLSNLEPFEKSLILEELQRHGQIFFVKSRDLTRIGIRRNLKLMYGHLDWFSNSLLEKLVLERFENHDVGSVTVILYVPIIKGSEIEVKRALRTILPLEKFERVIHGSDNWEETLVLGEVWTNENSISYMNRTPIGSEDRVLSYLRQHLGQSWNHSDLYVFDAGASLEVHGIRMTEDIDHICIISKHQIQIEEMGDCHNAIYANNALAVQTRIEDPRTFFRLANFKFSTLEQEIIRALRMANTKSLNDVSKIIETLQRTGSYTYFDNEREDRLKAWRRKSRIQVGLDRLLATLPPNLRRAISQIALTFRNRI